MKADPAAQRRLLDLQATDTALTQLAYRRGHLPELAELDRLDGELRDATDEQVRAETAVEDLDRDISRLERDVDQVRQRAAKDRQRLDSGSGGAKELESLQHELASLGRRQSELEDSELELMEQREAAERTLAAATGRQSEVRGEREATEQRRDTALVEIAAEEERRRAERERFSVGLPEDLVALYERIRANTGIGAAVLRARRCEGCRLELSGSDLAAVRGAPPNEVVRHEECGRILVRTDESGL
ncbi:MAG TPA: C4-type zinc ribbon domain-containing protein [Actinocatenispora sp.]